MALKSTPEFRLRVWPASAIPRAVSASFALADVIGAMLRRDRGEAGGADSSKNWTKQKSFTLIGKSLRYVNFSEGELKQGVDGDTDSILSGLCLTPQTVWVHSRISGDRFRAPDSDTTYKTIRWRGVKGNRWRTVQADRSPRVTGIFHADQPINTDVIAETIDYLEANQQIRLDLSSLQVSHGPIKLTVLPSPEPEDPENPDDDFPDDDGSPDDDDNGGGPIVGTGDGGDGPIVGTFSTFSASDAAQATTTATDQQVLILPGQTTKARIRIEIGGGYSLLLPQDSYATVERRTADNKGWEAWKELTALGKVEFTGDYSIFFERICGRLVIRIRDKTFYLTDVREEGDTHLEEIRWPRYRLRVTLYGVSARTELALLNYKHILEAMEKLPKKSALLSAIRNNETVRGLICVRRSVKRNGIGVLSGDRTLVTTGWRRNGSSIIADYDSTAPITGTASVPYTVALLPSPDGHETPLLTTVQGEIEGTFETSDEEPYDISEAYANHDETTAEPGTTAGAEISVAVSRTILDSILPQWDSIIVENAYNPVAFSVRYHNDDGTYTPWVTRLKGYVWQLNKSSGGFGDDAMTMVLRDPMIRLKEPAGKVDDTFPTGGMIYARKSKSPVYAGEIIKAILKHVLGNDEAARMNGNGNASRYSPHGSRVPLLALENDTIGYYTDSQMPQTSIIPFAPEYWGDAISWMEKLAKDDSGGNSVAVILFGYPAGDGANESDAVEDTWPCFIYGDVREILASRTQWVIADAIYDFGDQDHALEATETQSRPEHDYNTWIVANTAPGVDKGILPATHIGRDQLPDSDPRSPANSWPRTAVIELSTAHSSLKYVQSIASLFSQDADGAAPNNPQFTFRADPKMQWGDLVYIKQMKVIGVDGADESDIALPINDWFRIIRLNMKGDGSARTYMASAVCTTLSTFEKIDLGLDETP